MVARIFLGNHALYPSGFNKNNKGAVVVNEVMRKLGDAQLVLRLKVFFVVSELLMGECDLVTMLSEFVYVSLLPWAAVYCKCC